MFNYFTFLVVMNPHQLITVRMTSTKKIQLLSSLYFGLTSAFKPLSLLSSTCFSDVAGSYCHSLVA